MKIKSRAARREFYAACIEFYYGDVDEPVFKNAQADIAFAGVRYSLAKARAGHAGGRARGQANLQANGQANPEAKPEERRSADGERSAGQTANETPTKEKEQEIEATNVASSPQGPPFGLLCLEALNEELGTSYSSLPSKAAAHLARMAGSYGADEVRRMVAFKRDEWRGTRFEGCLTPNTLFGPDHFEQYMHQAKAGKGADVDFSAYA